MQWLFWSGFGILIVFIIGYLESLGYSSVQIGVVRAAGAVGAVSGSFLWSTVADRSRRIGTVAVIILACGIAIFPLFIIADGRFLPTLAVFMATMFFLVPILTLIDSWTTQMTRLNPAVSYGVTRAMGSLGFAVAVMVAGRVFDAVGIEFLFPAYAIGLVLLLPIILLQRRRTQAALANSLAADAQAGVVADALLLADTSVPDADALATDADASVPDAAAAVDEAGGRFLNRQFVTFLAIGAALIACFASTIVYMPLLMSALGGSHRHVGMGFSVLALSEAPFMIFSALLLRRFKDTRVIALALLFFFFRLLSFALVQSPTGLIAVQVLRGMSFALYLPAATSFCSRIVPRRYRTRALALLGLLFFGVGDIFASLVGGWLIALYDVRTMYAIFSAAIVVPIVVYWLKFTPLWTPRWERWLPPK